VNYKYVIAIAVSCLLVGRYVLTPKQEIKEVVKIVEVEKKRSETDKKTVTKETTKKDGTIIKETVEVENTVVDSERDTRIDSSKSTKTGSGITLGLLALKDASDLRNPVEYGALVGVPLIGNLNVIGTVDTSKRVGVGLSIEF
jgi:hypothetical protein